MLRYCLTHIGSSMKPEFRKLRIRQLERAYTAYREAAKVPRPQRGWLRAVREATGLTMQEMAERLGHKSRALAAYLEKSEAEYTISLGNLRQAAEALGCQLVYAIVPKNGSFEELVEQRARAKAIENVQAVEHTMSLEDQAVGGTDEKIEEHTKRILQRR